MAEDVFQRIQDAQNRHDLDAFVACFDSDYQSDQPVHPDLLERRMKALAAGGSNETVFLRADKLIPYGEVLHVMDLIRKSGVTRIALVTVPAGSTAGR